ncbi:MAG: ornithine carbamoyltransferase [Deltaproteobacteria bacterium]|nr:ornithine carbamoyltransferase [Deltaproteobacteria bacterium]
MTRPTDRRTCKGKRRDLKNSFDLGNSDRLMRLLRRAQDLKRAQQEQRVAPTLSGRVVGMLFEKHSTRTRVSFEAGVQRLGGGTVVLNKETTQLSRGEPIEDTAKVMSGYVDAMVIRTTGQERIEQWAEHASIPVVNALTDLDHPCQILTDAFTVWERSEAPFTMPWAYIGDGNNMANGYIALAGLLQMELRIACPKGYEPDSKYVEKATEMGGQIHILHDVMEAAAGASVLCTDVWASMGQEDKQKEREAAFADFQLNAKVVNVASEPLVLHCLPAHRGEEISAEVLDSEHSVIFEQAHNRMPAQQALLEDLLQIDL